MAQPHILKERKKEIKLIWQNVRIGDCVKDM